MSEKVKDQSEDDAAVNADLDEIVIDSLVKRIRAKNYPVFEAPEN